MAAAAAARLLGSCLCCPGLGETATDEVDGRVNGWLRSRLGFLDAKQSVTVLLGECIAQRVI